MSLVEHGDGIIKMQGTFAGQHFKRDRSGNHCSAMQRRVKSRTDAQAKQRNAFSKARRYTKDPRWVSYYIYQALNNLPFIFDAIVSGDMWPDLTGRYILAGTYDNKDYYHNAGFDYLIFFKIESNKWYIANDTEAPSGAFWIGNTTIEGKYEGLKPEYGQAHVKLQVQPPPADYNPPHLQAPKNPSA